jgi:thioesterase domain-containing protein/acyl carrier protein
MVPSAYAQMAELPLNANGKLDRKRLLALALKPAPRQFEEARDSLETSLQQIWAEVLGRRNINISVSDNFFDIGGHSIKAVLVSARISRAFQKEIPVRLIFDKPTIKEQASFVRGDANLNSPGSLVPIQRAGSRQPIFCVHPFFGLAHCYQEMSRLLGPDQPFYGLQCYGLETDQAPLSTIPQMAKFYLDDIRTVQPHGPYQLAGWSMGALIAYELAGQLAAEGETVSFLGLFEGHVPQYTGQPSAPSRNEWEKLVDEREAENFRYMAKQVPTSEEEVSDPSLRMGRYLAEFTQAPVEFSREQFSRLSRIIAINQLAVESYRPGSYPGNVNLFRVPGQADAERSYGWAEIVRGELKIFEVPGTHDGFMSAPSVNVIASHLKCLLHGNSPPSGKAS